jgi:hypothetical protein
MDIEQMLLQATSISLQVDEYHQPDGGVADDYEGPHLFAVAFAGRLATLTSAGRLARRLPDEQMRVLLEASTAARGESVPPGMDTAVGRPLTVLRGRVDHARGPKESFSFSATVNHLVPSALPQGWSTLLRAMRDVVGVCPETVGNTWDLAMQWTGPVALGPKWDDGSVVRLPHVVTSFRTDSGFYLRSGQPPGPSTLYRVTYKSVENLSRRAFLEPEPTYARRWRLPCGGGVLASHEEWNQPCRFVLRADDDRGLFVQRA